MLNTDSMNFEENLDYKAWFYKMMQPARHKQDEILFAFMFFKIVIPNDIEMKEFKEGIAKAVECNELDKEYLEIIKNLNPYLIWAKKVKADILLWVDASKDLKDLNKENFRNSARKSFLTYLKAISIFSSTAADTLAIDVMDDKKLTFLLKDVAMYYINISKPLSEDELTNFDFENFKTIAGIIYSAQNIDLEACLKTKINIDYDEVED